MSVTLGLSPEKQAELEQRAAAAGTDVTRFILDAVQERLEERDGSSVESVPFAQWRGEFRSWIASHASRNPQFNDSRDAIYD